MNMRRREGKNEGMNVRRREKKNGRVRAQKLRKIFFAGEKKS